MEATNHPTGQGLQILGKAQIHEFVIPSKKINEGEDMKVFLVSKAYRDILTFLMQLNHAMFPLQASGHDSGQASVTSFETNSQVGKYSFVVSQLQNLLKAIDSINDEVELDTGPRRFGNVSFRKWYEILEARSEDLMVHHLPEGVTTFKYGGSVSSTQELKAYLYGSFGSAQRLDYGTGHELSFLAFLGCIWKLGGFGLNPSEDDLRQIVLGVIDPYLTLVRKLILRYSLEPAGSHGVWGLDDHSFLPYIFGSAQYGPAIKATDPVPTEGALKGATDPGNVAKANIVERERHRNMYFGAIGFIYDVKKGPFWEHSPTLYDISGVRAGWGKINKGMLKMYDAEVLGKFPVVQHFPFGSLFSFDRDPDAVVPAATAHMINQPSRQTPTTQTPATQVPSAMTSMKAPWSASPNAGSGTQAPWASRSSQGSAAPRQTTTSQATVRSSIASPAQSTSAQSSDMPPPTKAPWAK